MNVNTSTTKADFNHIPVAQVRTILTDWCKQQFDYTDEQIAEIVDNTGKLIRAEGYQEAVDRIAGKILYHGADTYLRFHNPYETKETG